MRSTLDERYALFPPREHDDRSSHGNRQLIGALGLVQPLLLWLIAGLRPMPPLPRWEVLSSVSAYYYTGAVAAFVGILIALAVFLFTYRGYGNKDGPRDRAAATVAAVAGVLVAFFPTRAPCHACVLPWWRPWMGYVHQSSATLLFLTFIYFSLVLFPKTGQTAQGKPSLDKRTRNAIYRFCGIAMALSVSAAFVAYLLSKPIFWPEALALEFFAVSWLAKGRVEVTAVALARRALRYGRSMIRRR